MNKRNYQKELDKLIENIKKEGRVPRLFLHSCCAPCSSYVLEYLSQYFEITVFFYNPNISLEEEYRKRVAEIRRLVAEMPFIRIDPSSAGSMPQIRFRRVDFPQPDGPTTARNSPGIRSNDIFERAFVSPDIV